MADRTIQFKGMGFGATPSNITVKVDGATVFSGDITTQDITPSNDPNIAVPLFTTTVTPIEYYGTKSMSITVNTGTVSFGAIAANYNPLRNTAILEPVWANVTITPPNPVTTTQALATIATPPFSAEEIATLELPYDQTDPAVETAILAAHGIQLYVSSGADVFADIYPTAGISPAIDGVPYVIPEPKPEPASGEWNLLVNAGEVLTFILDIPQYGPSAGLAA